MTIAAWQMLGYSFYVVLAAGLLGIISWGLTRLRHPERRGLISDPKAERRRKDEDEAEMDLWLQSW